MKRAHMAVVAIAVGSFWVGTKVARCAEEAAPWHVTGMPSGALVVWQSSACPLAVITDEPSEVVVDWACIEQRAKEPMRGDITTAYARVLKAIHDGTAVNK